MKGLSAGQAPDNGLAETGFGFSPSDGESDGGYIDVQGESGDAATESAALSTDSPATSEAMASAERRDQALDDESDHSVNQVTISLQLKDADRQVKPDVLYVQMVQAALLGASQSTAEVRTALQIVFNALHHEQEASKASFKVCQRFFDLWYVCRNGGRSLAEDEIRFLLTVLDDMGFAVSSQPMFKLMEPAEIANFIGGVVINPTYGQAVAPQLADYVDVEGADGDADGIYGQAVAPRSAADYADDDGIYGNQADGGLLYSLDGASSTNKPKVAVLVNGVIQYVESDDLRAQAQAVPASARGANQSPSGVTYDAASAAPTYDLGGAAGGESSDAIYDVGDAGAEGDGNDPIYDMGAAAGAAAGAESDGNDPIYDVGDAPAGERSDASRDEIYDVASSGGGTVNRGQRMQAAARAAGPLQNAPPVPVRRPTATSTPPSYLAAQPYEEDMYAAVGEGDDPNTLYLTPQTAKPPLPAPRRSTAWSDKSSLYEVSLDAVKAAPEEALLVYFDRVVLPQKGFIQRHPKALIGTGIFLVAAAAAAAAAMGSGAASGGAEPGQDESCSNDGSPLLQMCALAVRDAGAYAVSQLGVTITPETLLTLYNNMRNATLVVAAGITAYDPHALVSLVHRCNDTTLDALCVSPEWVETLESLAIDPDIDVFFSTSDLEVNEGDVLPLATLFDISVGKGVATNYHLSTFSGARLLEQVENTLVPVEFTNGQFDVSPDTLDRYVVAGEHSDFYGSASFDIEVDAISAYSDQVSIRSAPARATFSVLPQPGTVMHAGVDAVSGIETDFLPLNITFSTTEAGESVVGRQLQGPAGMVVQQRVNNIWQTIEPEEGVVTLMPEVPLQIKLPQGQHELVVKPCVDYGAAEPACALDTVRIAASVNYAPPTLEFNAPSVSWVEGQRRSLSSILDASQIDVTKGNVTQYTFSEFSQLQLIDLRTDMPVQLSNGSIEVVSDDVEHYALTALSDEYYGDASVGMQVQVDGLDGSQLNSVVQSVRANIEPSLGPVTVHGNVTFNGVSDQFIELDTRFSADEPGEAVVSRRLSGLPAGSVVQRFDANQWTNVTVFEETAVLPAAGGVRVMLPQGDYALSMQPCVDYGAAENTCDLDAVTITVAVNYASPVLEFNAPNISWIEGQNQTLSGLIGASQIDVTRGRVSQYILSDFSQLQLIDLRTRIPAPLNNGTVSVSVDDVEHYALVAEAADYFGAASVDMQVQVDGLDGSQLDSAVQTVNAVIEPMLGPVTVHGNVTFSGVSDQFIMIDTTFSADQVGETVVSRRLSGLPAGSAVQRFEADQWVAVTVSDEAVTLPATSGVRVMLPPGDHAVTMLPCVNYGAPQPACQYQETLSFAVAHPAPVTQLSCPTDSLLVEDGVTGLDQVYAAMNATIEHGTIETLVFTNLSDTLSVRNISAQAIMPTAQGAYVIPVDALEDYQLTTAQHAYGEMTFDVALGVKSFNGPTSVTPSQACAFNVTPVADAVTVAGVASQSDYYTIPSEFDVQFMVVEGESLLARDLINITAGVKVEVPAEGQVWQNVTVTDGVARLPATGLFRVTAPEGEHQFGLVPCVNIGDGVERCQYAPTPLTLNATPVPRPVVTFRDPDLRINEGGRIPLTQFLPNAQNATLTAVEVALSEGVSLWQGATKLDSRAVSMSPAQMSQYSVGLASPFGYGDNQSFALQATVTRLDGQSATLDPVTRTFDVTPVAGGVVYNGDVSIEAFIDKAMTLQSQFVLQHTDGESFANMTIDQLPTDVELLRADGASGYLPVAVTNGAATLPLATNGSFDIQLLSDTAQSFNLRLTPQTNYGAAVPKTDHNATIVAVTVKPVPVAVVTFDDPNEAVDEGSQVALSAYAAAVENGSIEGYVLSVLSGTKLYLDGQSIGAASVTVPVADVNRYSIGTPLDTDYGVKTFRLKPLVRNLAGELVDTAAQTRSVTFNAVPGSVSATGPTSLSVPEDAWKTMTRGFAVEAGESVTSFRLGNVPSHMQVQYHNGNGFVNAARSGNTETIPVSGNSVSLRFRTATKGDFTFSQQAVLNYDGSNTVTKDLDELDVKVNCVLADCSLMTCAEAKAKAHAEGGNGCECVSNSQNTINTNLGGPNGFIGGCKDSFCTDKYSALSECSRP